MRGDLFEQIRTLHETYALKDACMEFLNGDVHIMSYNSSKLKENSKQRDDSRHLKVYITLLRRSLSFKIRNTIVNIEIFIASGKI